MILFDSGIIDAPTKAHMSVPRCGLPDISSEEDVVRHKRYSVCEFIWPKPVRLHAQFVSYSTQFSEAEQERLAVKALRVSHITHSFAPI